jgi:hypothetical protein
MAKFAIVLTTLFGRLKRFFAHLKNSFDSVIVAVAAAPPC